MNHHRRISQAIRDALDEQGVELTWHNTDTAAEAVIEALASVFESAERYDDMADS